MANTTSTSDAATRMSDAEWETWDDVAREPSEFSGYDWSEEQPRIEKTAEKLVAKDIRASKTLPLQVYLTAGLIGVGMYGTMLGGEYLFKNPEIITNVTDKVTSGVSELFTEAVTAQPADAWAKIIKIKPYYLLAARYDGKYEQLTGGRAAWRYRNSCKLLHGDFTREMGALGSDGKLAVFPTYKTGRKACEKMLFDSDLGFKELTLGEAMKKFAPNKGLKSSVAAAIKSTGVSADTLMMNLTPGQRNLLLDAIEKEEKYIIGQILIFEDKAAWENEGW